MNFFLVVSTCLLAAVSAMPRYVLVPEHSLSIMTPHVRVPRQVINNMALPDAEAEDKSDDRYVRQSDHYGPSHVDYGAYTGGHGAFGWYTDHPVGNKHH